MTAAQDGQTRCARLPACESRGIAALTSFAPCPGALRRNKALHLTAQPSSLRLAACSGR
jgi:hypothetical protein